MALTVTVSVLFLLNISNVAGAPQNDTFQFAVITFLMPQTPQQENKVVCSDRIYRWMRCREITHCIVAPCCWECLQSLGEGQQTSRTFLLESMVNHYQGRVPSQRGGLDSAVSLHKDKAAVVKNKHTQLSGAIQKDF